MCMRIYLDHYSYTHAVNDYTQNRPILREQQAVLFNPGISKRTNQKHTRIRRKFQPALTAPFND